MFAFHEINSTLDLASYCELALSLYKNVCGGAKREEELRNRDALLYRHESSKSRHQKCNCRQVFQPIWVDDQQYIINMNH